MSTTLPVAGSPAVRLRVRELAREHRRGLLVAGLLQVLAAAAALVPPRLLGRLVGGVGEGLSTAEVDRTTALLVAVVLLGTVLTRAARLRSFVLGEQVLAELREQFVDGVLALPLGTVERAGTGDLLARTTSDVDALSKTVRFAVPEVTIALLTTAATVVAMVLAAPLASCAALVAVPVLVLASRRYFRLAPAAYLWERATDAAFAARVTETAQAGRTVEALARTQERIALAEDDLAVAWEGEMRTLRLRCAFFPSAEVAYVLPCVATLLASGLLAMHGHATLAQVTAVTLYARQLVDPLDQLLSWLDELQVGATCFARLLGVREVPPDRVVTGAQPAGEQLLAEQVEFAYVPGRLALSGVDLALVPGERLAVVGPSGAGKSTLGRLLAGVHPPQGGRVTVGGADLVGLPLEQLRREVCLVTQEHHVFVGSLRDNLRLAVPEAPDADLLRALEAVDWVPLVGGLDEQLGAGALALSPAQAQQVALARLVLADPHTLVLDEATALLDPTAARHVERSLAAVVTGRTVVAIAHRLHTASDADRVAVVEDGRVVELGTHHELVAAQGSYAALWRSWHGEPDPPGVPSGA